MIVIIDYNMGNPGSIRNMLKKIGAEGIISSARSDIEQAEKLILPGVGSFDQGILSLNRLGLIPLLEDKVLRLKTPILGICLGMQMLCRQSQEGKLPGLSWIDAEVLRFPPPDATGLKVPHMGWNTIEVVRGNPLLPSTKDKQRFYFVHSYRVMCNDAAAPIALAEYGDKFVAAFQQDNIFGVQFHPEKSHRFGMELMKRFAGI